MNLVRVDETYQKLSDALLNLGNVLFKEFREDVEDIKVILPKKMHVALFGRCNGIHVVVVEGPFGRFKVETEEV